MKNESNSNLDRLKCSNSVSTTTMTTMNQTDINNAISQAFANLSVLNEQVYDYWVSELYTVDGDINEQEWNEKNLNEMEVDVMQNSWIISISNLDRLKCSNSVSTTRNFSLNIASRIQFLLPC